MNRGPAAERLAANAKDVLAQNWRVNHTVPSESNYPHQWLWDSSFNAIGLSHIDPLAAATEIRALLGAQWDNGMVPNIRFTKNWNGKTSHDHLLWARPFAPGVKKDIYTSTITQPPVIAEACAYIARSLKPDDAQEFLQTVVPRLVAYHKWIYTNRDIDNDGLMVAIHPWESGLDNTPPSMTKLREAEGGPIKDRVNEILAKGVKGFRRDLETMDEDERMLGTDAIMCLESLFHIATSRYDTATLKRKNRFLVKDILMNSVLARNNSVLVELAQQIGYTIPDSLLEKIAQTAASLNSLWDEKSGLFCSQDATTGAPLRQSSIGGLMPLYSGVITQERADLLAHAITDPSRFGTAFGIPSVPLDSPDFEERRYWSGPTWINTNWLVIQGLKRFRHQDKAAELTEQTLKMVSDNGMFEYFSALSGKGIGIDNFSWTAALTLDLLNS